MGLEITANNGLGFVALLLMSLGGAWLVILLVWFIFVAPYRLCAVERERADKAERALSHISWAWDFIGAVMIHDPRNENMAWQLYLSFRNRTGVPLRSALTRRSIVIEQTLPDVVLHNTETASITTPGQHFSVGLPPYSAKPLFKESRALTGTIDVLIKYGHADGAFTRIATFPLSFTLDLRHHQVVTQRGVTIRFPVQVHQREELTDEAWKESK